MRQYFYYGVTPMLHVDYGRGEATSQPIRISKGLDEAIEEFLLTEKARKLGFRYKSDIINAAVRDLLTKYGFSTEPRFEHFNVYEDHVTVFDREKRRLVDVYFRDGRAYCEYDDAFDCDHIRFALSIPKVVEDLRKRGWRIEEGRIIQSP